MESNIFLPYQKKWLNDKSIVKLAAKSRRIGFTWIQSFEDVMDALTLKIRGKAVDVWFTSADESAAKEYILYCKYWAKSLNAGVKDLGEQLLDEEKGIKALSIEFANGARINAISSNPSAFRSKGGKVVIDEFAFHKNPRELWKAAKPVVTWGFPLRIISSLNGTNNLFFSFIQLIKKGKLNWSFHKIPIQKAVAQGLVDKIYDRPTTKEERKAWLKELKESCGSEETWLQEFCCIALDSASAFISLELIDKCSDDTLIDDLSTCKGELFVGFDVARTKDLSTIFVFEKLGSVKYLRKKYELKNEKFKTQRNILYKILTLPNCRRCAIDETGIGKQMAEEAQDDFGKNKVEAITFNQKTKEELAYKLYYAFEDFNIRIPDDELLKYDIHSVKKMPTATGVLRFDADRAETDGHADRFWACALAMFAADSKTFIKPEIISSKLNNNKGFELGFNLRGLGGILRGL